jgi:uncharacterized protein (UPF0248 family)
VVHPLRNILNRLRWDNTENPRNYLISYRHRGAPNDTKQINASRIGKLGKSYFTITDDSESSEEVIIPFHRILEIRNTSNETILWKSRKKE